MYWAAHFPLTCLASAGECLGGEGWTLNDGSCYLALTTGDDTQLTWQQARDRCFAVGGDLVSINSEAERNFTITLVRVYQLRKANQRTIDIA